MDWRLFHFHAKNCFFTSLIMLPKYVHMGWKFYGELKPSVSLLLKNIFTYLKYFIHVALVVLIQYVNQCRPDRFSKNIVIMQVLSNV